MASFPALLVNLRAKRTDVSSRSDWTALTRGGRIICLAVALWLITTAVGCVNFDIVLRKQDEPALTPSQVVSNWDNQVQFVRDMKGWPHPGLVGRVYLFGPTMQAVKSNGSLVVEAYDVSRLPPGEQPKAPIEIWSFDKDNLKSLYREDRFLKGYTLFLPWQTYSPSITQVMLVVRFVPEQGLPVHAANTVVSLQPQGLPPPQIMSRTVVPAAGLSSGFATGAPLPPPPAAAPPSEPRIQSTSIPLPPRTPARLNYSTPR